MLLRRVCGFLFFLYYLQALNHLEGEAHYATILALVLEVDGLVVVVDEDLRHKPARVVESLCPLRDILVLYLFGLFAHPRLLLPSVVLWLSLPQQTKAYSPECVEGWVLSPSGHGCVVLQVGVRTS